jgi:hypothetical protein
MLIWDEKDGSMEIKKLWREETRIVKKVNALVVDEKRVIVGGLTGDGKGAFEIWRQSN